MLTVRLTAKHNGGRQSHEEHLGAGSGLLAVDGQYQTAQTGKQDLQSRDFMIGFHFYRILT